MVKKAVKKSKQPAKAAKKKAVKPTRKAMASVRIATVTKKAAPAVPSVESLVHRLDALLHTMRSIAQHEDELCTLLHDTRRTRKPSKALLRELQAVLHALPAEEYADDLQAVLEIATAAY